MARRERRAYPSICKERATPPEAFSPSRPPGCAAIDDGLRCSSVTEPCGYAPSSRLAHRQLRLQRDPPHLFHRLLDFPCQAQLRKMGKKETSKWRMLSPFRFRRRLPGQERGHLARHQTNAGRSPRSNLTPAYSSEKHGRRST